MKKATAILCSDFHLREDIPVCRTDDFWTAQWEKVDFIHMLAKAEGCPVIHAGDLFHHWKPSPYLLSTTIDLLPPNFWTVYGQHDLPQHNLELVEKCGINVLKTAGKLKVLHGLHWGQEPEKPFRPENIHSMNCNGMEVLVWHHMTYITPPFPGAEGGQAQGLLKKYPEYSLIVTGDNHQSFYTKFKGRLLVNPGSMMRQTADQADQEPCVYLWYAETNTVEKVILPHKKGVVSREHIDRQKAHNNRIDAFISRLNNEWASTISFEDNLDRLIKANNIRQSVIQIIYNAVE